MDGNLLVALVDDDRIYHLLTRKLLESTACTSGILEFYDGQEGIDYLESHKTEECNLPDVIFLDIQMPYLDGWQFLEKFSKMELKKEIKIYLVSSSISSYDHDKFKQSATIKEFIVKPFTRNRLEEIIKSLAA